MYGTLIFIKSLEDRREPLAGRHIEEFIIGEKYIINIEILTNNGISYVRLKYLAYMIIGTNTK